MSVLMKKHHTEQGDRKEIAKKIKMKSATSRGVYCATENGTVLCIPKNEIKHYQIKDVNKIAVMQQKIEKELSSRLGHKGIFSIFSPLNEAHGEQGALLKGIRVRENITQEQFSAIIGITQPELSKMESGKRPVGKEIAKRLETAFGINYRLFL